MKGVSKESCDTAGAENIALLTECSQYNCVRHCSLSGFLVWKLLKCHCICFLLLSSSKCGFVVCTLCFKVPTDESHEVLNKENGGAKNLS